MSGRPPRTPFPPSPTSSPSFNGRLLGCLSSFSSPCMLHLLLPVPEILPTAAAFSPILHHHQTMTGSWRWRALSPYATAVSQRQTLAACVTLQAPFTACSLRHDHNPIAVCLLRESPCFAGRFPKHKHCPGKKIAVSVFFAARLRRPLSNDVPLRAFFFSFLKLLSKISILTSFVTEL